MKKQLLAFCLCALSSIAIAQPLPYSFVVQQAPYVALTGSTSLNAGQTWDDPDYEALIGFDFEFNGQTFNTITMGGIDSYGGELMFGSIGDNSVFQHIMPYAQDLVDGGYFDDTDSQSNLSYLTTGSAGSRIFTMEWNNVAFYNDKTPNAIRINFQVRLHEGSNNMEFHYGPRTGLDDSIIQDYIGIVIGMSHDFDYNEYTFNPLWTFTGDPQAPTVQAFTDFNSFGVGEHLTTTPGENTVYFFSTTPISVEEAQLEAVRVYPSVVIETVNVILPGNDKAQLRILDNSGRLVSEQQIQPGFNSIPAGEWSSGVYIAVIQYGSEISSTRLVKY